MTTSTYRKVRAQLADQDVGNEDMAPCSRCQTATRRETLSLLGARCPSCYRAYCAEIPERPRVTYARDDWARSWAWNLKARHEAGERLTPAQVAAYTAALRTRDHHATQDQP